MEKISITQRISVYLICGMILVFSAAFFISPKREFSEEENRKLKGMPEFSKTALFDGSFAGGLKDYVTDQFPGRDNLLSYISAAERISGRKEINGVYLPGGTIMMNSYEEPVNVEKDITQFSKLAENTDADVYLCLVPSAVNIYRDLLPAYAPEDGKRQQEIIDVIYEGVSPRIKKVDASRALRQARYNDQALDDMYAADAPHYSVYYRTDHHWKVYGAYAAYMEFCETAGLTPYAQDLYSWNKVSDSFRGTIYSKLNDSYFGSDEITSVSCEYWDLTVDYGDGNVTDSPYNPDYLEKRDSYSYFLDNQHSFIEVTNNAMEGGEIAVVKDSYANCFIPFLFNHYRKVYIFDTRYYKGGPSKFINEHKGIEDVLILYNMGTLDNDTGIGGIY
ncbi:MAG: hypothetical protein IKI75_10975 [Lachnospiraceae bacterium]|nr:hypothetical protein [Lachnospiraceae bacterium]